MRTPLLLLVPLLLAGCLDAPPGSTGATHRLGGAFTGEATQAQVDEAQALARAEGGDMAILESFPLQLSVSGLSADACARLRAALAAKEYVARVGECAQATTSDDPDAPTSDAASPPSGASWGLHGSFTQDFAQDDVRAVCEAAGRAEGDCPMMKSLPPQYAFSYSTRDACEAARGRILAVPHVAGVTECGPR